MLTGLKARRSRLELYLTVLKAIKNGNEKQTRIMYESNLSWITLKDVLSSLEIQGLIEEIEMSESRDKRTIKIYRITTKGDHLLKHFHQTEKLLKID